MPLSYMQPSQVRPLERRPSSELLVGAHPPPPPPLSHRQVVCLWWSLGCRRRKLVLSGEDPWFDCVFHFILGVLCAKSQDNVVIYFFFRVLSVLCPPLQYSMHLGVFLDPSLVPKKTRERLSSQGHHQTLLLCYGPIPFWATPSEIKTWLYMQATRKVVIKHTWQILSN
jgi:hypothetical protein